MIDRLQGLPGVTSVSMSTSTPIHTSGSVRGLALEGLPETSEARGVWHNRVTAGYFATMGVTVLRGRALTDRATFGSTRVGLINETAARYVFGDADPIGRTFAFMNAPNDPIEIVGLTVDTHQESLRAQAPRMVYTPLAHEEQLPGHVQVSIKVADDPAVIAGLVRDAVRSVSTDLVIIHVRTSGQQIDASLVRERALMSLSTGFACLALVLASVGLYGVMSYNVTRRMREIGIRMALGARRRVVLGVVLHETLAMSVAGCVMGIGAALVATRAISSFLYGLSPRDPATLAGVTTMLIVTTLVAGYLPARRASRIDPVRAIRTD